jgi:protoporphyrinogen oxidase
MIIILGAGLTGLSIAYHLREKGIDFVIIEKEKKAGGLCRSIKSKNYIFDYTGHFLHTKSDYVKSFVEKLIPGIPEVKRKSFIYLKGKLIPYPFQANLAYLTLFDRLKSIFTYYFRKSKIPENLAEWFLTKFGRGMSELFFLPYNEKLWKYPLSKITPEFITSYTPEVSVLKSKKDIGYNVEFLYPERGIGVLTSALSNELEITHGEVNKIDKNFVIFNDEKIRYEYIISTIPLPELLSMLYLGENIPVNANSLVWNSVLCVNLGIKGDLCLIKFLNSEKDYSLSKSPMGFHWIYFPEKHFPFYRIGSYSNISPLMAPEGCSSLWVEVSYRETRPKKNIIDETIDNLSNLGLLSQNNTIDHIVPVDIPYAYPIYNKDREKIITTLNSFLDKYKIKLAGRFGAWKYSYMSESILEGKRISEELCRG